MNAQILLVLELLRHRMGQAAEAQLDGVAVLHQRGHVFRQRPQHVGDRVGRGLGDGVVGLDEIVHLLDGDPGGAVDVGQVLVDLKNAQVADVEDLGLCLLGAGHVDVAVFIRRRDGGDEDIGLGAAVADGVDGLVDVMGHIVGPAGGVDLAHGRPVEHGIDLDPLADGAVHQERILLVGIGAPDIHMFHVVQYPVELPEDVSGLVAVETMIYRIPVMDHVQCVVNGNEFRTIEGLLFLCHCSTLLWFFRITDYYNASDPGTQALFCNSAQIGA